MIRIKRTFHLILTLAAMLTMAQTAWAGTTTETRTATWYMDGGTSGKTNVDGTHVLNSGGMTLEYKNNNTAANTIYMNSSNNQVVFRLNIISCGGFLEFTNLQGTVKKVEFTNVRFYNDMQMYVGKDKNDNSTLLHVAGNASDYDFPSIDSQEAGNATFEGSLAVSPSSPLRIMFSSSNSETSGYFGFRNGTIVVTYDVEVEITDDPGHTFTFAANASSDAIIATCTEGSADHNCGLTNRQVTMPFEANDVPYDGFRHYASLNQTAFNNAGITNIAAILSYKDKSTNETLENPPAVIGSYTATANVTVTYKNVAHPFTLTTDFDIYNGVIACNYPQFSFSPIPAIAGNDVTITFTPLAGETVTSLTLTGAMANMSLDNGITDNHDGTYTFTMVSESLTLDATFSEPDVSNFEQTGTDEYTIKTANGWNWFCYALNSSLVADGFSGKTVKLGTSVGSSEMAGTSGHPFKGTFDGQGNTLTFNLQASEGYSAPFHYTDGATISNLHVTGLIEGNDISPLAGLVGKATGNLTISNCHVSTQISTTHSGAGFHGGIIAFWDDSNVECTITGCVYDGLIYNPSEANVTSYCSGFIGNFWGRDKTTVTFTDCLYAPAEYTGGKKALREDYGCGTFFYPDSDPTYRMTNCYYTRNLGKRQGRPATTATVAPGNLGAATTDHGIVDGYKNGFLYDGNYYTPKYGDVVVEYPFDDDEERASVTINGTNNQGTGVNVVGVNITEEVGNIKSVTYNRPFTAAQASTVILPFNYICNGSEGGKFYGFKEVVYDEDLHKWVCTMVEPGNTAVTMLTANTPYLFMPSETTMTFPNISSMTGGVVTLQPTTANDGLYGGATTDAAWNFHGSYKGKSWAVASNDYGFAATSGIEAGGAATVEAGQFVRFAPGAFIKPMRCYLSYVGTSAPAPARGLTRAAATDDLPQSITVRLVSRNGDVNAIGEINMETGEFDFSGWYTLDGVKLSDIRSKFKVQVLVGCVQRGDEVFIPYGDFVLKSGDRIGVTAPHTELAKFIRSTGLFQRQAKDVMILGGGRISYYLSEMLTSIGSGVKIIDKDEDVCNALSNALPHAMVILGDGIQQELLLEEGINNTDAFVSLTGLDETNILVSTFAMMNEVPTVITKINRDELIPMAEKIGVESIISPKKIVSNIVLRYARALENSKGSNIETLYKLMDDKVEAIEFNVREDSRLANTVLKDLTLRENILIIGIVRDRRIIVPEGSTEILAGDRVVVITTLKGLDDISDILAK